MHGDLFVAKFRVKSHTMAFFAMIGNPWVDVMSAKCTFWIPPPGSLCSKVMHDVSDAHELPPATAHREFPLQDYMQATKNILGQVAKRANVVAMQATRAFCLTDKASAEMIAYSVGWNPKNIYYEALESNEYQVTFFSSSDAESSQYAFSTGNPWLVVMILHFSVYSTLLDRFTAEVAALEKRKLKDSETETLRRRLARHFFRAAQHALETFA